MRPPNSGGLPGNSHPWSNCERCQRRDHSGMCEVDRDRSVASASGGRCSFRKATNSARNASTFSSKVSCTALPRGRLHHRHYQVLHIRKVVSPCRDSCQYQVVGNRRPSSYCRRATCWTERRSSSPASRARSPCRSPERWPSATRCGARRACETPQDIDDLVAVGITPVPLDMSTGDFSALPGDFTYVFHAAVDPGADDWTRCLKTNAQNSGELLYHCRTAKGFVLCSTGSVYGYPGQRPLTEADGPGVPAAGQLQLLQDRGGVRLRLDLRAIRDTADDHPNLLHLRPAGRSARRPA